MKIKAGRFLLVFVSFNVLFLSLYVFTSSLSARIFTEDEPGFMWNGRIQKSEPVSDSGSVLPESLLSVSLPINGGKSNPEMVASDGRESVGVAGEAGGSGMVESEDFALPGPEVQTVKADSPEMYFGESAEPVAGVGVSAELQAEQSVELNNPTELQAAQPVEVVDSAGLKVENQEALMAVTDAEEKIIALSDKPLEKPVEESESLSEPKKNWIEEWEESGAALVLNHVIHNPFERDHKPTVYVKRTADGFQVRLQKSALRNLHGDLLAQDHLELWLQDKSIRPPKNYGEISYQFGIGLGETPWVSEFLGTKPELNLRAVRAELDGFIEIQITGLSKKRYEWNLVFSGSFFQQEWVQGYLLSAAENFRWGCSDGLLQ